MTLKELTTELSKVEDTVKVLRRSDFEISGDVAFVAAMRQHIVVSLNEIRRALDDMMVSLDHVDDVERIMKQAEQKPGLMGRIQKALGSSEP